MTDERSGCLHRPRTSSVSSDTPSIMYRGSITLPSDLLILRPDLSRTTGCNSLAPRATVQTHQARAPATPAA